MIVLGFDTATRATAVGLLLSDGRLLDARDDPEEGERPGHATTLLPLAHSLLLDAGLAFRDVDRIAVGLGPGTFTGLRIGVATARGLAQSLGVDAVGVSSLHALAHAANHDGLDAVLSAIDARRGEVFVAAYHRHLELLAPEPLAPAYLGELRERVDATAGRRQWTALGDGAVRYRHEMERAGVLVPEDASPLHRVNGRSVCELGLLCEPVNTQILPDYRRRPDAEIARPRPRGCDLNGAVREGALRGASS